MSFVPVKSDGTLQPWEYLPAAAGSYRVGQLLNVSNGRLVAVSAASQVTPPYVCMSDAVVETAGTPVAVARVGGNAIFETQLGANASSAAVGSRMKITAGGLAVEAASGSESGCFELTEVRGTSRYDVVRGRFI